MKVQMKLKLKFTVELRLQRHIALRNLRLIALFHSVSSSLPLLQNLPDPASPSPSSLPVDCPRRTCWPWFFIFVFVNDMKCSLIFSRRPADTDPGKIEALGEVRPHQQHLP
jgi:hypothetical protein